jgi:hypothetical protein
MCHADINMVMWKHQRLPRVTHIWNFWVILWTSKNVPRGSPYNHVADHTVTWQDELEDRTQTWKGDCIMVDMAQWLAATWLSHGLPCGSEKMPNDNPRTNFKKYI